MELSILSVAELKALMNQIPKEIERRSKAEKATLMKEINDLVQSRGFDINEVLGNDAAPVAKERKAVKIKYRHPNNPDLTWTGRGLKPNWVKEYLGNGGELDSLKVE